MKAADYTGQQFGSRIIIRQDGYIIDNNGHKNIAWIARCIYCGNERRVRTCCLRDLGNCRCTVTKIKKPDKQICKYNSGVLCGEQTEENCLCCGWYKDYLKGGKT